MNKLVKRLLAGVLVIALVIGGVIGGLVLYRNASIKPVNVFMASDFAVTEYWGDNAESYGMVKADHVQTVYPSDTQAVNEIYVKAGDKVKVGDSLVALDTTLSAISLEKAEIACQRLDIQIKDAEKQLKFISAMKPHSMVLVRPEQKQFDFKSHATPSIISGAGTEKDPYYCLWGRDDVLNQALLEEYWKKKNGGGGTPSTEEPATAEEGETEAETGDTPSPMNGGDTYIAFVTREHNALNAKITAEWGLRVTMKDGQPQLRYYQPVLSEAIRAYDYNPDPYYVESGSDYTASEIAKMKADKEKEIADMTLQSKIAKVDLEKLKKEVSDGVVKSTIDGIVKTVRDPEEAYAANLPVVEVSGGGGYYIEVSMSEMDLESLQIGDEVQVNDWASGMVYPGYIKEISEYPTTDGNAWANGNTNVSFYPFTVFVDESAALEENSYVSVTYSLAPKDNSGFYLENQFIRTEGGVSYVFIKGEDGKLEKRTVQTGRSLWGSHTEIRGGITTEDRVAFPYGKNVKSGVKTRDAMPEDFYSMT